MLFNRIKIRVIFSIKIVLNFSRKKHVKIGQKNVLNFTKKSREKFDLKTIKNSRKKLMDIHNARLWIKNSAPSLLYYLIDDKDSAGSRSDPTLGTSVFARQIPERSSKNRREAEPYNRHLKEIFNNVNQVNRRSYQER